MPYSKDHPGVYVTNGGTILNHGQPAKVAAGSRGFVGIAVKQGMNRWSVTPADQHKIQANEPFYLIIHGEVQVDNVAGFAVGDDVYISPTNTLTETPAGATPFGQVVEVVGQDRGVPAGKVRIDLDMKASALA
jgi:hypothetical protein